MEGTATNVSAIVRKIVFPIAVLLSLFHLYTGGFGLYTAMLQRNFHLTLVLILIFLLYPIHSSLKWRWLDYFFISLVTGSGIYIYTTYEDLLFRVGSPDILDKIFGIALILLVLEATRRVAGWVLAGIGGFFLIYAYFGDLFPGIFQTSGMSINRIISLVYMSTDGLWGTTLGIAATFVALFVIFGAFLNTTGAGKVFIDLAYIIGGRFRGGPAKVAVISSALMGSVNGSPVANVSSTGQFTIPLMKKVGYNPRVAAAVEAVASTGGTIMPPVMGAGAFVMAELTGIPYATIVLAALIPAILYYASVFLFVDFEAARQKLKGIPKKELPNFKETFFKGIHLYVGLGALIYLLVFKHTSPMFAAFWSIVLLIATYILFYFKQVNWKFFIEALENGAKSMLLVTAACATAGIVIGVINLTGMAITLTTLMINLGENSILLTLMVTMVACIIMGMGLPPTASYILLSVLTAPALIKLGIEVLYAHMFVYYFACLAPITPPVALAAYTGAGISGSNPLRTSFTSARIGLVAFLIPYMFIFGPELLGQGSFVGVSLTFVMAMVGVAMLAAGLTGWLIIDLLWYERILGLVSAIFLIYSSMVTDFIGISLMLAVFASIYFRKRFMEIDTESKVSEM